MIIHYYLYIPIWFYSNNVNFRTALNTYFFTFQSGSIQIGVMWSGSISVTSLHSNLVLFKLQMMFCHDIFLLPLHSNLVLFKYSRVILVFRAILNFTFQSGSIQILFLKFLLRFYFNFTFQSGSIQIKRPVCLPFLFVLYIPIWFYSNL